MDYAGFPGLEQLNTLRNDLFHASHGTGSPAYLFVCWLGHKVISVFSFPANILGMGCGMVGMLATACTVGTLKVIIFAVSLGHYKAKFPTGFMWCEERTVHSAYHIAYNVGELLYDLGNIFTIAFRRLEAGFEKACEVEPVCDSTLITPSFLTFCDDLASENRIDLSKSDRPFSKMGKHYLYSTLNIPLNALAAVICAAASAVLFAAFIGKILLYAATNLTIPIPTYAGKATNFTGATIYNVFADTATNVADIPIGLYKISEALLVGRLLARVAATARDVLFYIPEALFS